MDQENSSRPHDDDKPTPDCSAKANSDVTPSLLGDRENEATTPFVDDPRLDDNDNRDCLKVLLLGRTGQGKSTMGNKLLKAAGESVLRDYKIKEFEVGDEEESCTREIRSVFRSGTAETKAVEVIDTPGFADSNTVKRLGVYRANLAMFRDLIRERINGKLRIDRVLYFLPHRGPLERADAVLQEEIRVMYHFFGDKIFRSMVLVATHHQRYQQFGFSEEATKDTRKTFEKALTLACPKSDRLTCPPVLYFGFDDTGVVNIQQQIEGAAVTSDEGLILEQFVHGTCIKCAAKYLCQEGKPSDLKNQVGKDVPCKGKGQKDVIEACTLRQVSRCHPLFVPKYSYQKRFAGSAVNVVTLGIPGFVQGLRKRKLPWPTLTSKDEECENCKQSPWSDGCIEVGTTYTATRPTGESVDIIVDHINRFEDHHSKYWEVS